MLSMKKFARLSFSVLKGIGQLLFLYGFLGWLYGILIQLIHPEWLTLGLSHLIPWIRVDTFTIVCFVVSAFGFLIWRLTREVISSFSWIENQYLSYMRASFLFHYLTHLLSRQCYDFNSGFLMIFGCLCIYNHIRLWSLLPVLVELLVEVHFPKLTSRINERMVMFHSRSGFWV